MKRKNGIILVLCACMAVTACAKGNEPAQNQTEMGMEDTDGKDRAELTDAPENASEPLAPTKFVIPDEVMTPAPSPTPTPKVAKEKLTAEAKKIVSQYEKISFGSYEVKDETATMVRNSNLGNQGYVCGTEDGIIYFGDSAENKIYCANADGSGQELILEPGRRYYLQIEDGYLYFRGDGALCRYNLDTKDVERVMEQELMSCFSVSGQKVYYCGSKDGENGKGIYCYDMGTGQDELLVDTGGYYETNWMTATEDVIIYTFIDPEDHSFDKNGLLFAYFLKEGEAKYIRGNTWLPVLAGSRVFFRDRADDDILKSIDLNTGETVSYGKSMSSPSINEEKMYFTYANKLYCHEFQTGETTLCFENAGSMVSFNNIFQTSDYLYLYQGMDLTCYYNKNDGTYGKFGAE